MSAAEISGLPERKGYLKSGNLIVPLTVEKPSLPIHADGFISRQLSLKFPVRLEAKGKEPKHEPPLQQEEKCQPGQGRAFFE